MCKNIGVEVWCYPVSLARVVMPLICESTGHKYTCPRNENSLHVYSKLERYGYKISNPRTENTDSMQSELIIDWIMAALVNTNSTILLKRILAHILSHHAMLISLLHLISSHMWCIYVCDIFSCIECPLILHYRWWGSQNNSWGKIFGVKNTLIFLLL